MWVANLPAAPVDRQPAGQINPTTNNKVKSPACQPATDNFILPAGLRKEQQP